MDDDELRRWAAEWTEGWQGEVARGVLRLLEERDGLAHALDDMRREIMERFCRDGIDWMTALTEASKERSS